MVKRYRGNSGQVSWIEETQPEAVPATPPPPPAPLMPPTAPPPQTGQPRPMRGPGGLPALLGSLESGDVLMLLVLYLLYRESGDTELLVMIAALLFA